jgi:hypothetical protein
MVLIFEDGDFWELVQKTTSWNSYQFANKKTSEDGKLLGVLNKLEENSEARKW